MTGREVVMLERIGVVLSLVLLALGVAELTDTIDLLPTTVYVALLWVVALLLWLLRRRQS